MYQSVPAIRITLRPLRCTILGHRVHHGLIGLLLVLHDRSDWRAWLRDLVHYDG